MTGWEVLFGVAGVAVGLLPYLLSPDDLRRRASTHGSRGRRKKRERLDARKRFLVALHESAAEQARYLLQGALIVVAVVTAAFVLGVQISSTWPHAIPGFVWSCAVCLYLFTMYRLGVDRRIRRPALYEKMIGQLDEQLAVLQVIESYRDRCEPKPDR